MLIPALVKGQGDSVTLKVPGNRSIGFLEYLKQYLPQVPIPSHTHTISNVTGLQTALDGKQSAGNYAAASHTHTAGEISGLASATAPTVLSADVTNNNAVANTIADVTGLSFSVTAGTTYKFRFVIIYTAAATTTGARFSINGPATTILHYRSENSLTATSRTFNDGLSSYNLPAASNASSAATGSNIAVIEGVITPSASGTVIARFASEVASSAIVVKAKSYVEYQTL